MTTYKSIKGSSLENIVDTGTEGTKIALGTTAQRGTTPGQWRYNSTTGNYEGINSDLTVSSLEPDPSILSVDDSEVDSDGGGNQTFVITGTGFTVGGVISFVGNDQSSFDASTTTHDSNTQQTAVVPKSSFDNAKEPYAIKYTSLRGKFGYLENIINVDNAPTWTTAAGNLTTIAHDATGTHATVAATDAEGDTVAYTETTSVLTAQAGLAVDSSTGAITGDPTDVVNPTTHSFDLRATAGGKYTDRTFNIIVVEPDKFTGGCVLTEYSYNSVDYQVFTYRSDGEFIIGSARIADIFVLGGGGSGGGGNNSNGSGGAGSGGLLWRPAKSLVAGTYTVTVGAGGIYSGSQQNGNPGEDSIFTGNGYTLTGDGGGGGKQSNGLANGGSGGGTRRDGNHTAPGYSTQTNNEDSSAYAYGNSGGGSAQGGCFSAGGGGGTGQSGIAGGHDCNSGRSHPQSEGGKGVSSINSLDETAFSHFLWSAQVGTDDTEVSGAQTDTNTAGLLLSGLSSRPSKVYIGAGGGGAYETGSTSNLPYGGMGGGGRGGSRYGGSLPTTDGLVNTGSGGGGGVTYNASASGGNGGSGVVIVRIVA